MKRAIGIPLLVAGQAIVALVPRVLTAAQMDATLDGSKRRRKCGRQGERHWM